MLWRAMLSPVSVFGQYQEFAPPNPDTAVTILKAFQDCRGRRTKPSFFKVSASSTVIFASVTLRMVEGVTPDGEHSCKMGSFKEDTVISPSSNRTEFCTMESSSSTTS